MKNQIECNQAINFKSHAEKADHYIIAVQEILRFFGKNTLAQMLRFNLYADFIEVHTALIDKDYSEYLFKKIDELIVTFNEELESEDFKKLSDKILQTVKAINEKYNEKRN